WCVRGQTEGVLPNMAARVSMLERPQERRPDRAASQGGRPELRRRGAKRNQACLRRRRRPSSPNARRPRRRVRPGVRARAGSGHWSACCEEPAAHAAGRTSDQGEQTMSELRTRSVEKASTSAAAAVRLCAVEKTFARGAEQITVLNGVDLQMPTGAFEA